MCPSPLSSKSLRTLVLCLALGLSAGLSSAARADVSTEERFQDLFVTAGYSAAFGAALGAAFLAFESNPSENLQYISIGASLGFIGGSVAGTYIIFQPMLGENSPDAPTGNLMARNDRQGTLRVRPHFDVETREVSRVEGVYTAFTF